ncbi:hypothetical protein KPL71_004697 [Citrus sinensis]|uniref:Uncharacterized protein n=1 Tax=Citrus sinensis TaxID=2711 RepID=A0ACB8N841_CITSI|nr:hypothetical protein KPL71_004697 [Citrus sinensis]
MVEGETFRIGERSTETISGDTSGGRRDLSNRYSAPVIGGQKIDVEKFDGKINFGMWRREVMDALIQIDLDVVLKNKRHLYDEEIWDRMNEKACGQIRFCLTKEVKYLVKDEECAVTLWRTLEEKYLVKSPENRLHAMSQVYGFRMKPGVSMHDHVSRFEKLLADLKNLDEDIKDEVILLHSLPEDYSHFVTTLIYGKSVIIFKDVCTTLTNLEIQNNNKNSERASSEALVSRDWAMEKKKKRGGKNSRSKSRSRNIARDECAFCHEKGHWRKNCPKAQKRDGKKPASANMARKDEGSDYSLIVMGNDQPCRTMGIGTIRPKMFDGMVRELKEVRFVPALKKNLISVGALEAKGYKVTIEDGIMKFTYGAMVILQGVRRHNLYYLKGGTIDEANVVEAYSDTTKLWHVRLGHAGEKSLQTLMRHGLLKGTKTCKLNFCEHCVVGKKTRVKFGTANHDTREILEYVHSDVWGPTKTASIGGSHYFVTFVDDFSRRVWVYTMRAKDEVLEIFVKWKKLVETQTGRKIKVLRSDNGGEYTSDPFLQVCQNEGIKRHFTVRHTPQQNGVAERMNRTLLEKVRCMLSNAGLDKKFWAEAVSYASHLVNRLPSAAIKGKTPMEMWSRKHAQDYDSLRVFGCPAYYHVKDGKLDPRARKSIFVGFKGGVKGFKLWDLEDKKFVCSRYVIFDEASMIKASSSQQVENKTTEVLQRVKFDATPYVPVSSTSKNGSTMEVTPKVEEEVVSSDVPQNEETIDDVDDDDFIATRRPRREIKKPGWLTKDMVIAYALPVIDDDIPNTFDEALRSNESDQWKQAMEEEMKSLHQNQTWELVKLPKGKRAIGNKWVYTKKQGSSNQTTHRYKARLVAKGFAQKKGIDYNEVFSPVVKHTSIRILLALVAEYELELAQLDVKTTFLHGDLEEEIYMIQPCGFKVAGNDNHVCRRLPDRAFIYLLLYVDDMLIASKNRDEIERLKKQLASEFEMKDLGDAQKILGMEICRDKKNRSVWLTQKSYLKKVLERFGMDDKTKPVCTPLAPHFKLGSSSCPKSQEERDYMARVPYASAVGSLMYAMVCTRPDISQAVSMVSRYMHDPGKSHWLAVKWILRYLYGTVDVGLLFKKDCGQQCVGYCDSDFAGDLDKRRSTTGYIFTLGGGPVSWRSILQSTIALSTTEAEYMVATEAVKEAIWLKGLLGDLGVIQENITVFCDNQSVIFLAKNQTYHARTKHIDVKYHYVREIIESGVVLLRKIDTKDNPSDMLTKKAHCAELRKERKSEAKVHQQCHVNNAESAEFVKQQGEFTCVARNQVLASIRGNRLEGYINGEKAAPTQFLTSGSYAETIGRVTQQVENPEYTIWRSQDQTLLSWLLSSITEGILSHVHSCNTAYDVWKTLEKNFGAKSKARVLQLKYEMSVLRKDSLNIEDYCLKMKQIADKLACASSPVSDKDLLQQILNGLGPGYLDLAIFITASKLDFDDSYALLLTHETRLEQSLNEKQMFNANLANVSHNNNSYGMMNAYYAQTRGNARRGGYNGGFHGGNQFGRNNFHTGRGMFVNSHSRGFPSGSGNFGNNLGRGQMIGNNNKHAQFMRGQYSVNSGLSNSDGNDEQAVVCQYALRLDTHQLNVGIAAYSGIPHMYNPPCSSYISDSMSLPMNGAGAAYAANLEGPADEGWYLDSGATHHLTNDMANMHVSNEFRGNDKLIISDGKGLSITHVGNANFKVQSSKTQSASTCIALKDILLVPSITKNLISVSKLTTDNDLSIEFLGSVCFVKDILKGNILLLGIAKKDPNFHPSNKPKSDTYCTITPIQVFQLSTLPVISDFSVTSNESFSQAYSRGNIFPPAVVSIQVTDQQPSNTDRNNPSTPTVLLFVPDTILDQPSDENSQNQHNNNTSHINQTVITSPSLNQHHMITRGKAEHHKLVGNKWVFRVKSNTDGSVAKYKARLVAKGFQQIEGVNYFETFSPVVKAATVRVVLSLAVINQWQIRQVDVNNAFLNGDLIEEVYMSQPKGFIDSKRPDFVCKLHKALCGLKQAPRACVYLSQRKYIRDLLAKVDMLECKDYKLQKNVAGEMGYYIKDPSHYRSIVGGLQYLVLTRPEIAYSVHKLSQYVASPTLQHLMACKRLLRYLKETQDYGLKFVKEGELKVTTFTDAEWGSDLDDRRSTGAYCVYLGNNLISWSSKKQSVVTKSSAESEYRALAATVSEITWLKSLFLEIDLCCVEKPVIWCDNVSAKELAYNPVFHSRTKHIEIDLHFIRDKVLVGDLKIIYVPSAEQMADIMTKPLNSHQFIYMRNKLNVHLCPLSLRGALKKVHCAKLRKERKS